MIELRVLGPIDLRAADGSEIRSIISQPKRLALLAYLAVDPGVFRRRDTLLALFWPELDQQRGRGALRQAIYYLRRALGGEVVIARGDDELGIDAAHLWCDAAAFRQAINEKRFRTAVELHRGDLLSGVYVDQALELERWIDEERLRLRLLAAKAAWTAAEGEEHAGDISAAATWARRAVELGPDDEESARRLITLLARTGDHAGALRVYQDLARRLEREYEAAPSAATQALISEIKAAVPAHPAPAETSAEALRPTKDEPSQAAPRSARDRSATIAVLPFTFSGKPELGYLGEGMADLLGLAICGTEELNCLDTRAILTWFTKQGRGAGTERLTDPELCRAVGERFNAGLCILGGIVQAGDQLRAQATLYASGSPEAPRLRVAAESGIDEPLALADRLAAQLLVQGVGAPASELARTAALTTDSLPALKLYLNGEQAIRAGRFTPAVEMFQRAVLEDPHFSLAHYRIAALAEWAGLIPLAQGAAAEALRGADRLPVNDRRLLEALHAYIEGDIQRAERLYREIIAIYPESTEAWAQLAKLGYFLNSLRGRRFVEAAAPLERARALDPDNIITLAHLANVTAKEGRHDELDALVDRALELQHGADYTDFPLILGVLRAFTLRDRDALASIWEELETANEFTLFWCFMILTLLVGDLEAAGRVAEIMMLPARPREVQLYGCLMRAELEAARGSWARARAELERAERIDPPTAMIHRALLALLEYRDPEIAELYALREELTAPPDDAGAPETALTPWFSAHIRILGAVRSYLLGLVHVRLGEWAAAEGCARELEHHTGEFAEVAFARDAACGIRARLALHRDHDPDEALGWLERCQLAAPMHCYIPSPCFGRLHERFLRAELLAHLGRETEAETWYAALSEDSPHGFIYLAASHLRRAELHQGRGEFGEAQAHYDRYRELWQGGDPEPRPVHGGAGDAPAPPGPATAAVPAAGMRMEDATLPSERRAAPRSRRWRRGRWGRGAKVAAAIGAVLLLAAVVLLQMRRATRAAYAVLGDDISVLADVTTRSLVALRFYQEGLRNYYAGDLNSAGHLFNAAVAEDSAFAMAMYYASLTTPFPRSADLLNDAVRLARRASDRERLLIEGAWAAANDDPRRLALAESLAARYPAEPAGHLLLGQARIWSGDFLDATPHLRQAVAMDSISLRQATAGCRACEALWELTTAYTMADSLDAAQRVAREWLERSPRSATPWVAMAYALDAQGHSGRALAALDSAIARQPGPHYIEIRGATLIRSAAFGELEEMVRERLRSGGQSTKEDALWWLALAQRTRGRPGEARQTVLQLQRLAALPTASPAELVFYFAAEAQALLESGRAHEAARIFERVAGVEIVNQSSARNARHQAWLLTHAATAYAELGDTARLHLLADSVQRLGALSAYGRDQRLHHHIRGLRLRLQGRHVEAAEEFRKSVFSPVSGFTRTNYELARALLESGHPDEAVATLEAALRGPIGATGFYLTRAEIHERLAQALIDAGRAREAVPHLRWVIEAWSEGEPPFAQRAEEARRRLASRPDA